MDAHNVVNLSDLELEILNIVWLIGPSSVREVHEVLEKTNNVRYTVTLRLMQSMHHRELMERDERMKKHIYSTTVSMEAIQDQLVQRMIKNLFGGSSTQLMKHLLDHHKYNQEELTEISKYFG